PGVGGEEETAVATATTPSPSHLHQLPDPVFLAEDAQVAGDFIAVACRLFRVVGQLDRRAAVRLRDLADQRNGVEPVRRGRRTAFEIVREVGAPAEGHANPALEM